MHAVFYIEPSDPLLQELSLQLDIGFDHEILVQARKQLVAIPSANYYYYYCISRQ